MKRLFIFVFICLFYCSGQKTSEPTIAKVGNIVLTQEMIKEEFKVDNSIDIGFDQKKDYVDRWVEKEVLYREAVKRGLKDDPSIKNELTDMEKVLSIDKLLDIEVEGKLGISDEEIISYYQKNLEEYRYFENEYNYEQIKVKSISDRNRVINANNKKKTFTEISREITNVVFVRRSGNFSKESGIQPIVLKVILELKPAGWKRRTINKEHNFIKLIDKRNKGDIKELELVKNEIIPKILAKKRKERYNQLVNLLKEKSRTEVDYSQIGFLGDEMISMPDTTADTTAGKPDTTMQ